MAKENRAKTSGKRKKSAAVIVAGVLAAAALILAGLYVIGNIAEERKYDRIREELDKEFGQNKVSPEKEKSAADSTDTVSEAGSDSVVSIGDINDKGFTLTMPRSTFPKGSYLSYTPLSDEETAEYVNEEEYSFLQNPANIECDNYNGGLFAENVEYTVPIPEGVDLDRLAFAYLNEETKQARIIYPDHFDLENMTMSVSLPHFSNAAALTLKEQRQVEEFLDQYSKKTVVEQDSRKQAAEALEPYVAAKVKALGLKKEAEADLIKSALGYLGGCFKGDEFNPQKYGDTIETGTKTAIALMDAVMEGDIESQEEALQDIVTGAIMHGLDERKMSDRINDALESEFAGDTVGTIAGNTNAMARMATRMAEGDWKGAAEELGGIMQGVHPAVEFTTKGTVYIARCVDLEFVTWKQNEIEELYQAYRNGAEGLFGNEILKQDPDSLKTFLQTSSGYTKGKMVNRFYNLDRIEEVCDKNGWDFEEYKKLADKYRDKFEARATDALIDYFDTRIRQEEEAEKIKEKERMSIETMLQPTIGVLKAGNYEKFFGENEAVPYNLPDRLERLVRVRGLISQYVDEEALEKSMKLGKDGYNWGDILNWWVMRVTEYPREEALQDFLKTLQEAKLLKPGMEKLIREEINEPIENTEGGYWRLRETNVTSHENEIGADGYASYYYSASELTHTEQVHQPATDYHESGEATIISYCSAPPQVIQPEEPVVMQVSMDISFGGYYLLWGSYASVSYGAPNDERNGIMYNAGVKFEATDEDAENSAYLDTVGNTPCPEAEVCHVFDKGYEAGSEMAILFSGCGSDTLWIYEWVE